MSTESISPIMQSQQIELANIKGILNKMYLSKTESMEYLGRYELEYLVSTDQIRTKNDKKRKWLCNASDVLRHANYKRRSELKDEELHKTQA